MAKIKCIGCFDLLREEIVRKGVKLVVYTCPRYFPYACALSGLLQPGSGIVEAVKDCPEHPEGHCILCSKTEVTHYGDLPIATCEKHFEAWSKWLNEHPELEKFLHPRGRVITANWIEVFREFIEDMRAKGSPGKNAKAEREALL